MNDSFKVTQLVNRELGFQPRSFHFLSFIYDTINTVIFDLFSTAIHFFLKGRYYFIESCYFIHLFLFIFLFLAALGLRSGELGLLFVAERGFLIAVASLVAEHRL